MTPIGFRPVEIAPPSSPEDATLTGDTMNIHERFSQPHAVGDCASASSKPGMLRGLWARVANWVGTCADYYEAAALYEELSQLSDAELARRGLDRPNLARDLCEACDKGGRSPADRSSTMK